MRTQAKSITRVVTLENGLLFTLASNSNFVSEFPILKRLREYSQQKRGCGDCGSAPAAINQARVLNDVKAGLVGMDDQRRGRLKQMLNATEVAVSVMEGNFVRRKTF